MSLRETIIFKYPKLIQGTHYSISENETGEFLSEWNVENIPMPSEEELQQWYFEWKKNEKRIILHQSSTLEIYEGFTSTTTGYQYEFSEYDQNNFTQQVLMLLLNPSITEVKWKTVDSGVVLHTKEQFFGVVNDAGLHKQEIMARLWQLESLLDNATTIEEIDSISWI